MVKRPTAARGSGRVRAAHALAIVGAAVVLVSCQTSREVVDNYPNDVRQRHPISIREGERVAELFIGTNRGVLTPTQRADVMAFAYSWRREATGGIIVDVPTGTQNERAAAEALSEVRSMLTSIGVPAHVVVARPYRPATPVKFATLRLKYPKMVADAGPCGLWPVDTGPTIYSRDAENRPYWNLGCANQRNLAAMVENPSDLVQPRGETSIYAARRSTVLEKFRKGEPTATQNPDAAKAKISDLGQ